MNITPNNSKRRHGKVAQLPQPLRDQINQLLDDGLTYAAIIKKLEPLGVSLSLNSLSQWFHGGFQDYLLDLFWHKQVARLQEKYAKSFSDARPAETSMQLAATVLDLLNHQTESLAIQEHHNAPAKESVPHPQSPASKPQSTEELRQAALDLAEEILGCRAYRHHKAPGSDATESSISNSSSRAGLQATEDVPSSFQPAGPPAPTSALPTSAANMSPICPILPISPISPDPAPTLAAPDQIEPFQGD